MDFITLIADFFVWIYNLSIPTLFFIMGGILLFLVFLIHCNSSFNKATFLEEFDNHTIAYFLFINLTIVPIFLLILYHFSILIFSIVVIVLFIIFRPFNVHRNMWGVREYRENIISQSIIRWYFTQRQRRINRRTALKTAKDFLRPYKKIFGKHTLSNKFCNVTYIPNKAKTKFICLNTQQNPNGTYQIFEAYNPYTFDYDNFFNSLCINFNYDLNFNLLHLIFQESDLQFNYTNCCASNFTKPAEYLMEEKLISNDFNKIQKSQKTTVNHQKIKQSEDDKYPHSVLKQIRKKEQEIIKNINNEKQKSKKKKITNANKININEASEAEITALPGINIVQAKRIIKYRNLNGDFKTVDDFLNYIKVKPHFADQLVDLVTITPKILKFDIKKTNDERIIDLD